MNSDLSIKEIPAPKDKLFKKSLHLLSVVIISFNEEKNIANCLDSVQKIADEIVVVDSFSTDRTVEIALHKGAKVQQEKFRGYIEQKNFAISLATYPLVLSIDADEILDERLIESIKNVKATSEMAAYSMNRRISYCGNFLRFGGWYPNKQIRLFFKDSGSWGGINPHDHFELKREATLIHLKGDIIHFSYNSIKDHIEQTNRFSHIAAESYFKVGRRSNWFRFSLYPLYMFIHNYVFRFGFLDGYYGFIAAIISSKYIYLKYKKLFQLKKQINSVVN